MDQRVEAAAPYITMMTDDAKGIVLKEAVRRATVVIRRERAIFEAFAKESYSGTMDDVFTTADTKAQESYLRNLRECFPDYGILAEEASLSVEPKRGCTAVFTVDPLDGTKAFVRRQSHGIGTMIALVDKGEVVSAFVGDINTEELYGYRPGSTKAHRITRLESVQQLGYDGGDVLAKSYALLRDPPEAYSKLTRESIPAFKNYESSGGSIGIWFARLWKREVAALFVPPGTETPWDSNPIIGISKKLGYLFFKPGKDESGDDAWEYYDPAPVLQVAKRDHDFLVIHKHDWSQFKGFMSF